MQLAIEAKTVWRVLRAAGLLIGFAFIAWVIGQLLRDPQLHRIKFSRNGLIAAIGVGIVANLAIAIAFSDMVGKYAPDTSIRKRFTAFYYAQIAKYVPGKVATLLVQRSVLSGANATTATIASNLELMAISCWLCGSAAVVLLAWPYSKLGATATAVIAVAIGAWLLIADWRGILRPFISLLGRSQATNVIANPTQRVAWLRSIMLSLAMLILPVVSSYALLIHGMDIDKATGLQLCAILLLSWIGGLLAFIFPAGIGVRELIFFSLGGVLAYPPEPALLASIALASRAVQVSIDVSGVLFFVAIDRTICHRVMHEEP